MQITVNAARLNLDNEPTMNKEKVIEYAKDKVEKSLSIFDAKEATADILFKTEGEFGRVVQKIEITVNVGGKHIRQEAHSRNIYKTIDRAGDELRRQMQKYKTKRLDHRREKSTEDKKKRQREYTKNQNQFIENYE